MAALTPAAALTGAFGAGAAATTGVTFFATGFAAAGFAAAGFSTMGAAATGAGADLTAGRSNSILTLESAVRGAWNWLEASGAAAGAFAGWAGTFAALAATVPVKASPDAARMTAARRPELKRNDMKKPLPMPA